MFFQTGYCRFKRLIELKIHFDTIHFSKFALLFQKLIILAIPGLNGTRFKLLESLQTPVNH